MPPRNSSSRPCTSRARKAQSKAQAPEQPKAAKGSAKPGKASQDGDLIGSRVRVQASDHDFYEGTVDGWNSQTRQYHILFDDGDDAETAIDETTWDVQVISSGGSSSIAKQSEDPKLHPSHGNGSGNDSAASVKNTPVNKRVWTEEVPSDDDFMEDVKSSKPSRKAAGKRVKLTYEEEEVRGK
eukprot:CAMPEP_0181290040 /NCGR_PEP_ID=MMETSP1101-20121128/1207_1 /TAXON_ID=46948 /ORGANISM="Rhodomonas abbreviata, Strain Caron Lab Isolate" /LENGTH=182 /DNA_ID=CAMNT_0023394309 /DNA_START=53 /DNA_END=598 /DNA_ORIENTATION=+